MRLIYFIIRFLASFMTPDLELRGQTFPHEGPQGIPATQAGTAGEFEGPVYRFPLPGPAALGKQLKRLGRVGMYDPIFFYGSICICLTRRALTSFDQFRGDKTPLKIL